MSFYLSIREVWRNRGRFVLFSLVIALITILVLFVAALGNGLANANRQFIDKLDADLIVLQENVDLNLTSSRITQDKLEDIKSIAGVAEAGLLAFSSATLVFDNGLETLDVSIIGVTPGELGNPSLLEGNPLNNSSANEIIIDNKVADNIGLQVGDQVSLRSIQGEDESFFDLTIAGITDERQFFFASSVIMSLTTWNEVRPQASPAPQSGDVLGNMVAVKLAGGVDQSIIEGRLINTIEKIEVADKITVIEAQPGYGPQQATVNAQKGFAYLIGVLGVGGFFQIQTLQKVPQLGMLKAIGTDNRTVGAAALMQIIIVTIIGILIGGIGVFLLYLGIPDSVPLSFNVPTVLTAIGSLLLIGPIGGLVSIRIALKVEPLTAIGLSS